MESVCWSLVCYLPPQNAEKKRFNHGKWRCCYRAIFQEGKKKSELHLNQMNLCTDLPMINYFCIFFWTKIIIEMAHLRLKQSLRVFGRKKILAMRHRRTKWSDKRKDMYFRNYVKSSQSSGYLVRHTRPTAIGCARGCKCHAALSRHKYFMSAHRKIVGNAFPVFRQYAENCALQQSMNEALEQCSCRTQIVES